MKENQRQNGEAVDTQSVIQISSYYFINCYVDVVQYLRVCVCVCANGFRLHLKTTNYSKLIASNAFVYVLNAIEIGNVRVSEQASQRLKKMCKDMCITYTTSKTIQHFVYGFSMSLTYRSFLLNRTVIYCAISICNRMEMYCRIRANQHTNILENDKKVHTVHDVYGMENEHKRNTQWQFKVWITIDLWGHRIYTFA